jgi:hypothetical protein
MRKELWIPLILALMGVMFLGAAASTYFVRGETVAACEACGMEVDKKDTSTFRILTKDGNTHYACCPVCALGIGAYHMDTVVEGLCYQCGKEITIKIANGELSPVNPVGPDYNVSMVFGKACTKNKLVCSNRCGKELVRTQQWASELPIVSIQKAFSTAKAKIPEFKMTPGKIETTVLSYALAGIGSAFMVAAAASWRLQRRKT